MSPEVKVKPIDSSAPAAAPEPTPKSTTKSAVARPLVQPRAPSGTKRQTKVLLSVADGKIEWEKMAPEQRKQFEQLFKNPEFLKAFGLNPKDAEVFDPEQCSYLYDVVSMALQSVCRMLLKFPPAALKVLAYSKEQKELLSEPTANLINRLAPKLLIENQELVVFATVFFSVTQQNFSEARRIAMEDARQQLEARKVAAAASPHSTAKPVQVEVIPPQKANGGTGATLPAIGVPPIIDASRGFVVGR